MTDFLFNIKLIYLQYALKLVNIFTEHDFNKDKNFTKHILKDCNKNNKAVSLFLDDLNNSDNLEIKQLKNKLEISIKIFKTFNFFIIFVLIFIPYFIFSIYLIFNFISPNIELQASSQESPKGGETSEILEIDSQSINKLGVLKDTNIINAPAILGILKTPEELKKPKALEIPEFKKTKPENEEKEKSTQVDSEKIKYDSIKKQIIFNLIKKCKEHMLKKEWTTGRNGAALDCYKKVDYMDSGNAAAREGILKIENEYIRLANFSIEKGNISLFYKYLNRIRRVNPESTLVKLIDSLN
ncbi:hypothetical protein QUF61_12015 [Candidatus Venteria ishoeyi]|uniref:hypothetical protein n=1 Tax=Candidatus Venteria ishoeyi TaxID=1899563 RepID=UPI0025A52E31|nr:hypothetical protein [Candidatus Venteria ishoeyi]MDM8547212.1 hypothetical protein [Candidatus Venteria ishoeyi]